MKCKIHELVIIGYGNMGSKHAVRIKAVENLHIKGVYDIDSEKMKKANDDGYSSYKSFDDVLNDRDVDIVLIATPNNLHKEIAVKALRAGKNVICEKPVTLNSKEFEEIIAKAAKETGAIVTAEEHNIIGGLGSAVCEVTAEVCPVPVVRVGVNDVFGKSGPAVEVLKHFGLTAENIAKNAMIAVSLKK